MEYGGTNGCLDDLTKFWKKEVEASHDWLKIQVSNIQIICFVSSKGDANVNQIREGLGAFKVLTVLLLPLIQKTV